MFAIEGRDSGRPRAWVQLGAGLVLLQSAGGLGLALRDGTPLGRMLGPEHGPPVDLALAVAVLAASLGFFGLSLAPRRPLRAGAPLALFVGGVTLLLIGLEVFAGEHFAAAVTPAAHAVRYLLPFALGALALGWPLASAARLVRWAAALVFFGHGVECLLGHPGFLDFLLVVPERVLGAQLELEQAAGLLTVIGLLDVALAAVVALVPARPALAWMVFWGLLTALVRVLFFGPSGWPDALVRLTNAGAPLLVLLALSRSARAPARLRRIEGG